MATTRTRDVAEPVPASGDATVAVATSPGAVATGKDAGDKLKATPDAALPAGRRREGAAAAVARSPGAVVDSSRAKTLATISRQPRTPPFLSRADERPAQVRAAMQGRPRIFLPDVVIVFVV